MDDGPIRQDAVIHGHFGIPGLPDESLELPYIEIQGRETGPRLTVLAGVHGYEVLACVLGRAQPPDERRAATDDLRSRAHA